MLLNFFVKNFLSFRDKSGFSLETNNKLKDLEGNCIKITSENQAIKILKSAVFYGMNASGKTNIFKALSFLKDISLTSFRADINGGINHPLFSPFLLDVETKNADSEIGIDFILDKQRYSYFLKFNRKGIIEERLSSFDLEGAKKIKDIFNRNKRGWTLDDDDLDLPDDIHKDLFGPRENVTGLSYFANIDTTGKSVARRILGWMQNINYLDSSFNFPGPTIDFHKKYKNQILDFLRKADFNIKSFQVEERILTEEDKKNLPFFEVNGQRISFPEKANELTFSHSVFQKGKEVTEEKFSLSRQESEGTKKLFFLLGPIFDSIDNNKILVIDEFDTHLHPLLVESVIHYIHNYINTKKSSAQFIFNTHNLDLMDLSIFRKDQIYFTSKNEYGSTEIFSLDDFKEYQIRKNSDIRKAYKSGLFGAIPLIFDL